MQLYAFDALGTLIAATVAYKRCDYRCPECGALVRVRRGVRRQAHFYHPAPDRYCRQQEKGAEHIQVQQRLSRLIPHLVIEERFPDIGRVADAVWHDQRLVFEVQCSAITAEELQQRNSDYGGAGYAVIWIFHESRYNKRRLSEAEEALAGNCFYTNIDAGGQGIIYDQLAYNNNGRRLLLAPPLAVDLSLPLPLPSLPRTAPRLLARRQHHFAGDLFDDFVINSGAARYRRLRWLERRRYCAFLMPLLRPYRLLLQMALESACRR